MATSRTGTGKWKNLRRKALALAQRNHITSCPECGIHLDYDTPRIRNSAEVDHIVSHAQGGADRLDNLRVICRLCNAKLGAKVGHQLRAEAKQGPVAGVVPTTQPW